MRKKNLITVLKKLVASFGGEGKGNNAVDLVDEFADVVAQGGGGGGIKVLDISYDPLVINPPIQLSATYNQIFKGIGPGSRTVFVFFYGSALYMYEDCELSFDKTGKINGYIVKFFNRSNSALTFRATRPDEQLVSQKIK